jgi:microcin C transport system ATP-binding protein
MTDKAAAPGRGVGGWARSGAALPDRAEKANPMTQPLLTVENLTVTFHQGGTRTQAVRNVSFRLAPGETLALVGESGSGKSVTAMSTVRLLPDNADVTGTIRYRGTDLARASERQLRATRGNDISFIFQEPMTSLNPLHTIQRQLAESLSLHQGLTGAEARARILELLTQVGIREPESRLGAYPHQLSGGQRQRVMIAMALANDPAILVADEPTTALDVTIQAQVLTLLAEIQARAGMAMLFITHDLNIVRRIATRVAVMKDGEIVETGPTEAIFQTPQHPYTRKLLAAEPSGAPDPLRGTAGPVIETRDLKVWFPVKRGFLRRTAGHVKAVDGATLSVHAGETLGIVGESGSGKTTLALALMRLISSDGPIAFLGQDIQGLRHRDLRRLRADMQIVFQDPYGSLSPRMSIEQIIAEGLRIHSPGGDLREKVAGILREVGLDPALMDRYPHEFSGGQRQRVAVARAMILHPKLVLLDEPTSALDMTVQVQIVDLLRNLQRKYGLAYVFISHDLRVVRALAHKVMVMQNGRVVEAGSSEQIFSAPTTDYTRTLMSAAFDLKAAE